MTNLVKRLHIFLFLYAGVTIYQESEKHKTEMVDLNQKIPVLKRKIKKVKREKENLERYFKDIKEAKQRIEKVAEGIEKLQRKLPPTISDTENLDLVRGLGESLNIKNLLLSPGSERAKDFLVSKTYKVRGTGTFLQYLILLEKIGEQERILNVKTVNFKRSRAKQKGRFQLLDAEITLEAFRSNEKYREDRGIKAIEDKFKVKGKVRPRKVRKKKKGRI